MKKFNKNIYNLFYMLKILFVECKGLAIFEFCMRIVRGLLPLLSVYLGKIIIDKISECYINNVQQVSFLFLLLIVIAILLIRILYEYLQILSTKTTIITSHKTSMKIEKILLTKLKDLDKSFFDSPETLNVIKRSSYFDSSTILRVYRIFMDIFRTFPTILTSIIILLNFRWVLAILSLILYIPLLFIERSKVKSLNELTMQITELDRKQSYYSNIVQDKEFSKEARIYGYADHFIKKYSDIRNEVFKKKWRLNVQNNLKYTVVNLLKIIVENIVYAYLVYLAMQKLISIGDIAFIHAAFMNVGSELKWNINSISQFIQSSQTVNYFRQFQNFENKIVTEQSKKLPKLQKTKGRHTIEFKNVSFTYPGSKEPVLKNLNFKIDYAQTLGIVGLNGAGKTTLVKLMLRLYNCDKGKILIDDKDIKNYSPEDYYFQWGALMQDYPLYSMDVAQNIALGQKDKDIDMNKIKSVSELCCVSDFIEPLKENYKTQLSKEFYSSGYEPSEGQSQKICFARAIYKDYELLVLDEPLSYIDAKSEYSIFNNINRQIDEKTTILISHKLTNVMNVDKIIVLDKGKIVEVGTHEELIKCNGEYAKLYQLQSERYITSLDKKLS